MTKEQCGAIIKAIEAATIFLYENGISTHEKCLTKTAEDAIIAAAVADFDSDIQAIISSIPDDDLEIVDPDDV